MRAKLYSAALTKPALCKGRGTTFGGGRVVKALCKAPEAAVQRRCGDHISGGGIVESPCSVDFVEYLNGFRTCYSGERLYTAVRIPGYYAVCNHSLKAFVRPLRNIALIGCGDVAPQKSAVERSCKNRNGFRTCQRIVRTERDAAVRLRLSADDSACCQRRNFFFRP